MNERHANHLGDPAADDPGFAVVLPTLDEGRRLGKCLDSVLTHVPPESVWIADGGSRDGSARQAGRRRGVNVRAELGGGRGGQIAAVLPEIRTDWILVVHADMRLSGAAVADLRSTTATTAAAGGCLGHVFRTGHPLARVVQWHDRRRARAGMSFGDQAQFFHRGRLDAVGGFPDLPLMEDYELSRRLLDLGRPLYLDTPVSVSARRYRHEGYLRTALRNHRLRRDYTRLGAAGAAELYRRYYGRSVPAVPAGTSA